MVYICGDFNVNLFNYDNHNYSEHFSDSLITSGLILFIDKLTNITSSYSNQLIDNVYINNICHTAISGLLINGITDHLTIFIIYSYHFQGDETKKFIYEGMCSDESL